MGMTLSSREAMDSGAQYISCVAGASFVKEGRNLVDTRASFLSSRVFPSLAKRNLTKIKKTNQRLPRRLRGLVRELAFEIKVIYLPHKGSVFSVPYF